MKETPKAPRSAKQFTTEFNRFLAAIEGKEKIVVTAADATNVTRVAEAAILSSNTGSPVYLDLK